MSFILSIVLVVLLYAVCGIAAGAMQRHLGLVSISHAAVLGAGAYSYALSSTSGAWMSIGMLLALCVGSAFGSLLAIMAVRVRGEAYTLATFGIQIVFLGVVSNVFFFGGALGVSNIPTPGIWELVYLLCLIVSVVALGYRQFQGTLLAGACAIVKRGPELARAVGLPLLPLLIFHGGLYGAILGISGAILAAYLTFIDASLFGVGVSVGILSIGIFVMEKGILGSTIGAFVIVGLPQALRLVGLSSSSAGYVQITLSGLVLFSVAIFWLQRRKES